jgi:copper chaperone CopZ
MNKRFACNWNETDNLLFVKGYLGHLPFEQKNGWIFPHSGVMKRQPPVGETIPPGGCGFYREEREEGMIGNKVLSLVAILFVLFLLIAAPVAAAEKTILLNIPGCNAWGAYARISSILKSLEGIIRFESPAENTVSVTFDDQKVDEEKIAHALDAGGVSLQGKQTPVQSPPFFYK